MKGFFHANCLTLCLMGSVFMVFACSKKERVPDGILNKEQMVNMLSELYVVEQKISVLGIKRDSLTQIFDVMKDSVFIKAGTTDSVFRQSLNYYMDRPEVFEGLYTALIDSLNLREQQLISSKPVK